VVGRLENLGGDSRGGGTQLWLTRLRRVNAVIRDEAIRVGIAALAEWHVHDHGEQCVRVEGEQFDIRSGAVIDALIADGSEVRGGDVRVHLRE
jgi:hypothetical protein